MKATHKFVGTHLEDLADGRLLEPGESYELDAAAVEHPHNVRLLEEGKLISLTSPARLGNQDEVIKGLADITDPAQLDAVETAEKADKSRAKVLSAIDARRAELAVPDTEGA